MQALRFFALQAISNRGAKRTKLAHQPVSDYFGSHALGFSQMRKVLSAEVYEQLCLTVECDQAISKQTASAVAIAVRVWAMERGATHYTHWFHPLTGATAEKHDAFFDHSKAVEELQASALVQQEPDASSFPSGGIRSTFEARGYTAWTPSSPFFIWDTTLCIPTIFISYTGEALDYKTPLLKSQQAVSRAATALCGHFDKKVQRVKAVAGWEQECFVVDRSLYQARPDLLMCNRTLFGRQPARGQQLNDHYFGSISPRILEYLKELEGVAYKLGIPLRTRHNEVAPSQYEVAPMFEEVQVAVDHNQLLCDVMQKTARNHDLEVLFHEKPFANLNGSGKHCNWSLCTDTGMNLMHPKEDVLFLIFFLLTLRGVYRHADLLRASVASYGNDFRLGAHEAPPAIISAFVGAQLERVIELLANKGSLQSSHNKKTLFSLGIDQLPAVLKDNTDRNRTSPFAFTGDKFEFRAVGSEANISGAMTVLNTLVAQEARQFTEKLQHMPAEKEKKLSFLTKLLSSYAREVKPIIFNGDGYAADWQVEAKRRGLPNLRTTPEALATYTDKRAVACLTGEKVFTVREINSRYEIELTNYIKKASIEASLMRDIIENHIIPTAVDYQNKLLKNLRGLKKIGIKKSPMLHTLKRIHELLILLTEGVVAMGEDMQAVAEISAVDVRAKAYAEKICGGYFDTLRNAVDELELIVDDEKWPLVKYREILFLR